MTGVRYRFGFKAIVRYMLFHQLSFMWWFRKCQQKETFFRRFILYKMSRKYGLEISIKAQIGKGLYLGHPYNITVAEGT